MPEDFDPFSHLSPEQARAIFAQMMTTSALDNVDTIPEVETNDMPLQGDKCCEDLRTELLRIENKYKETAAVVLFEVGDGLAADGDCEELVDSLDDLIGYAEHLLSRYIDPDAKVMIHGIQPKPFGSIKECLVDLQQAKLEYEACKMGGFGDVDHDMFYASVDPFEYSWNMIIKELGGFE